MTTSLRSLRIQRFRTIHDFTIELPVNGVVLLVGPNGLGKTAVFDAIEWALTGTVRRLAHIDKDLSSYLRSASSAQGPEVSMTFQSRGVPEQISLVRKDSKARLDASALDALLTPGLAADLRGDPLVLAEYLHATHLLVQDTRARFIALDDRDRWGPVGRFSRARLFSAADEALGPATMRAFSELRESTKGESDDLTRQIERIDDLLGQRQAAIDSLGLNGVPSREKLDADWGRLALEVRPPSLSADDGPASAIRRALADQQIELRRNEETLERLASVPAAWEELAAKRAHQVEQKARASGRHDLASGAVESAERDLADARGRQQSHETNLAVSRRHLQEAGAALGALHRMERAQDTRRISSELLDPARIEVESARANRDAASARRQILENRRGRWETGRNLLATLVTARAHLSAEQPECVRRIVELDANRATASATLDREAVVVADRQKQLQSLRPLLQDLRKHVSELQAAVAAIAAALAEDRQDCPVCGQEWRDRPGQLKQRAQIAANAVDPRLAAIEEEVASAERELKAHQAIVEELRTSLESVERELASEQARLRQAELAVAAATQGLVGWAGGDASDLDLRVGAALAALAEEIAQAEDVFKADPSGELEALDLLLADAVRRAANAQRDIDIAEQSEREAVAALSTYRGPEGDAAERGLLETRIEEHSVEVERIVHDLSNAQSIAVAAEGVCKQRQHELDVATEEMAMATASLAATEGELAAMRRRWQEAGLSGDPTIATLADSRKLLDTRWQNWREMQTRVEQLSAQEAALADSESIIRIDGLLADLAHANGGKEIPLLRQDVERRLEASKKRSQRIERVRAEVDSFRGRFAEERTAFYDQVLKPLSDTAEAFKRTLVTPFPVITGLTVGVDGRSAVVRHEGRFLDSGRSFDASGLLSEGQMASVALSYLLAMSVRYRWSQWSGLLLDDPVQHNDVVHVAAFADLLRSLIQQQNYQVILSTHDGDMAEFLRRKMERQSIPCSVFRFVSLKGGRVEIQSETARSRSDGASSGPSLPT